MKYFLIIFAFSIASCKKEDACTNCIGAERSSNATIIDGGQAGAVDGCGWLVMLEDSASYHPDVLSGSFQQNGLLVKVSYRQTTDSFLCGDLILARLTVIHITSISTR